MLNKMVRALTPGEDAITMLKADHRKVEGLFKEFEEAKDDKRSQVSLARSICEELALHDYLETKLFYPAAKTEVADSRSEVNEGIVEHEAIRRLVKEIPRLRASDEFFESRMTVLIEFVKHHVKEEERDMFPKIADSDLDLLALGDRMAKAKARRQRAKKESTTEAADTRQTKKNERDSRSSTHGA